MDEINNYKHLWDGSQPGWSLHWVDNYMYSATFKFGEQGPTKKQIIELRKILPEISSASIANVYAVLRNRKEYRCKENLSNSEAGELKERADNSGLKVEIETKQTGGYLPVFTDNTVLIIEDDNLAKRIIKKMLDAGVEVREIPDN